MTKTIKLTQGMFAIIDDCDFEEISKRKWCALKKQNGTFYAVRTENSKSFSMHRDICSAKKGEYVDHIDGNGLNNTRKNLRICTNQQNSYNKHRTRKVGKKSKYKGVRATTHGKQPWEARIKNNYKTIYLGSYMNEIDAAKAYDKAAIELFGEFAKPNFSREDACK